MLEGFRFMVPIGDPVNSMAVDKRQGAHKVYPGSHPLGGGSLYPASNIVYDHSCVYRRLHKRSCVARNVIYCMLVSLRVPLGGFIYASS
jgi:hypothetical protein